MLQVGQRFKTKYGVILEVLDIVDTWVKFRIRFEDGRTFETWEDEKKGINGKRFYCVMGHNVAI